MFAGRDHAGLFTRRDLDPLINLFACVVDGNLIAFNIQDKSCDVEIPLPELIWLLEQHIIVSFSD